MSILRKLLEKIKRFFDQIKQDQAAGAQRALLEDLFNDFYAHRGRIYRLNFVRGLFFGFGSVLGGTVLIALLIWLLSLFVDLPLIGEYFRDARETITQPQQVE